MTARARIRPEPETRVTAAADSISPAILRHIQTVADTWGKRFEEHGYGMWGGGPSSTLTTLIGEIEKQGNLRGQSLKGLEIGFGDGRDMRHLVFKAGHAYTGIEVAREAVTLARASYEKGCRQTRLVIPSATFLHGKSINNALIAHYGEQYDFGWGHRELHLETEEQMQLTAKELHGRIRDNGLVCIGARSVEDFKPDQMNWLPGKEGKVAAYKDNPGREMCFLSEEIYRNLFPSDKFEIISINHSTEPEMANKPDMTPVITMLARKLPEPPARLSASSARTTRTGRRARIRAAARAAVATAAEVVDTLRGAGLRDGLTL